MPANRAGQMIGPYRLREPLGEGGLASVYRASDLDRQREVVVKILRRGSAEPAQGEAVLKRLAQEAELLVQLDHPNLVKVYGYGEQAGQFYLVTDYLPGQTLKKQLGLPFAPAPAARLLAPIARALHYAHQHQLIHCDVKPANILVNSAGRPWLTDLGVARLLQADQSLGLFALPGIGLGTPMYMAPEQSWNQITPRTDVYALGIVFYELVTGRPPFIGDPPAAVVLKHVQDALPRPKTFAPDLPDDVERILFKALAKQPIDRYVDMAAFAEALEGIAASAPGRWPARKGARPAAPGPHRRRRWPGGMQRLRGWGLLALGLLVIGLVLGSLVAREKMVGVVTGRWPTATPVVIPTSRPTWTRAPVRTATLGPTAPATPRLPASR